MKTKIFSYHLSDLGNLRDNNEDNFIADDGLNLYIVADGMGGHAAGEVASQIAVEAIQKNVVQYQTTIDAFSEHPSIELSDAIQKILNNAVQTACNDIYRRSCANPEQEGMGTTVSAILIVGSTGFIAHVGDSSIYLYRKGILHKLTTDHSLVQERIDRGLIRVEDADKVSFKNILTRAVGTQEYVQVDTMPIRLADDDRLILSSDGLTNYLKRDDMIEVIANNEDGRIPHIFIELAKNRGGADNITTVFLHLELEEDYAPETSVDGMINLLREISLFHYLEYEELSKVMNVIRIKSYQKGSSIIAEGTSGEELYVIITGKVGIYRKEQQLGVLSKGDHFGEMSLIDNNPRSATIQAEEQTKLLVIDKTCLFRLMRMEPALSVKLLWNLTMILSLRLRTTNEELVYSRTELGFEQEKFKKVFWEGIE